MSAEDLRARYLQVLLDRLAETRYPSAPMMDRIEAAVADRSTAEAYIGYLIDHLSEDRYPSPAIADRVRGLLASI